MNSHDPVAALFQDVVLVLGGVFAVHPPSDRTVRKIARGLERAYQRAQSRRTPSQPPRRRHAALEQLLRSVSRAKDQS